MARKKANAASDEVCTGEEMADMVEMFQQNRPERESSQDWTDLDDDGRSVVGIYLTPFSLRWVLGSSCFTFGKVVQIVGPPESQKTALANEIGRWHIFNQIPVVPFDAATHFGIYRYLLAESGRDQPDFRQSILGAGVPPRNRYKIEGPPDGSGRKFECCEDWQVVLTDSLKLLQDAKDTKGKGRPLGWLPYSICQTVDSMTALNTRRNFDKTWETGHANASFGDVARSVTDYLKMFCARQAPWPATLLGVNHYKPRTNQATGAIEHNVPGGEHLKYASHFTLRLKRLKDVERKRDGVLGRTISIKMMKNSASIGNHREMEVDILWTPPRPAEGVLQNSWWEWDGATVTLLASFDGKLANKIDEIVTLENYDKSNQTVSCKQVGLTKGSWAEVGAAINGSPEISAALDNLFGIIPRTQFKVGIPYYKQQAAALEIGTPTAAPTTAAAAEAS